MKAGVKRRAGGGRRLSGTQTRPSWEFSAQGRHADKERGEEVWAIV